MPKVQKILSGITRNTIIKLAHNLNIKVVETDITLDDVYQADEAFFTGTAAEVTPIRSINDKRMGKNDVGEITAVIKKAYMDLVQGKNNEFMHYLTYVQ